LRKLASIRKISKIEPIEGADRIELVFLDGWQCVAKKGEFAVEDPAVYFELDSFIPVEPRYEFLRKSCFKKMSDGKAGFRLKTAKFKKQISQGLSLPLSLFPEIKTKEIGADVTQLLNVCLYELPIPAHLSGVIKGSFPGFCSRSDQERIQNLPEYFNDYKDVEFEETEKLDGSSCTFIYNNREFRVCSRNLELKEDENNTLWKLVKKAKIKEILEGLDRNVGIQGEMAGEGIQKNVLKLKGQHFYVFDIYDIDKKRYMTPDERNEFYSIIKGENNEIEHVPVINAKIRIFQNHDSMEKLLEYAEGKSIINPDTEREGVIFKSHTLPVGNTVSFKVINNNFLLK